MLQTLVRIALVTSAGLTIVAASTAAAMDEPPVVIRIYDAGASTAHLRAAAIRTAAAILDQAGIAADWHDCTEGVSPACQTPRPARDLIVRIMPATASALHPPSAAEVHANLEDADFPLGFAVVDPTRHTGAMATIFHDQVESVARRSGVDGSELLGRTLAHEIGHLLLGVRGHSRTGLMRAVWTDAELTMNRREDWVFTGPDRRRLKP
ncbi:MAG TPA: hypothetical protein VKB50_14315 [Vicinamibacterales bacterium]|nr:hypothetical protein [Vicinamibacterales bacterium]